MTIQIPNVGTGVPADQTGDSPWLAMKKVGENFSDQSNAASRLVGTGAGQIPVAQDILKVSMSTEGAYIGITDSNLYPVGSKAIQGDGGGNNGVGYQVVSTIAIANGAKIQVSVPENHGFGGKVIRYRLFSRPAIGYSNEWGVWTALYSEANTTKDANGFIKGASPVVDLYSDKIEMNEDAKLQPIAFEKLATGSYLVKGSLGFAKDGWYIETPKDANGNVLVAVVYEQLSNNDLSIKTYAKKFDDETGDIVANLLKPRDIPSGRFISLRLHELPKPSPVMPPEPPTEV